MFEKLVSEIFLKLSSISTCFATKTFIKPILRVGLHFMVMTLVKKAEKLYTEKLSGNKKLQFVKKEAEKYLEEFYPKIFKDLKAEELDDILIKFINECVDEYINKKVEKNEEENV